MKWLITLVCLFICATGLVAQDPETIGFLDLNRYTGKWYEIAHLPNVFQARCVGGSMATYRRLPNGQIEVKNECIKADGGIERVTGLARIEDKQTQSKLAVSFFEVLGVRPFWGDYWVLGVGDAYQYSVVGDRSRKYAWILSRTPKLPDADLKAALATLSQNGYKIDQLRYTKHD